MVGRLCRSRGPSRPEVYTLPRFRNHPDQVGMRQDRVRASARPRGQYSRRFSYLATFDILSGSLQYFRESATFRSVRGIPTGRPDTVRPHFSGPRRQWLRRFSKSSVGGNQPRGEHWMACSFPFLINTAGSHHPGPLGYSGRLQLSEAPPGDQPLLQRRTADLSRDTCPATTP